MPSSGKGQALLQRNLRICIIPLSQYNLAGGSKSCWIGVALVKVVNLFCQTTFFVVAVIAAMESDLQIEKPSNR